MRGELKIAIGSAVVFIGLWCIALFVDNATNFNGEGEIAKILLVVGLVLTFTINQVSWSSADSARQNEIDVA